MEYKTKYKCRSCGEIFYGHITSSKKVVLNALSAPEPFTTYVHFAEDYAENPHIGIGDLLGFEVSEE